MYIYLVRFLHVVAESVLCMIFPCVSELSSDLVLGVHQLTLRQSAVPRLSSISVCYKVNVTTHTVISGNSMDNLARLFQGNISNI